MCNLIDQSGRGPEILSKSMEVRPTRWAALKIQPDPRFKARGNPLFFDRVKRTRFPLLQSLDASAHKGGSPFSALALVRP
ncbi:hypothetical protein, partial [Aestuariispira insulae]|uniref:hypothetical protein n=1 Tax=Aestuariispira insulae TaxID=1461337 RepID=UPI001C3F9CAC